MDNKKNVLLVDDDSSNLMELFHILRADYNILTAIDGSSALEKASSFLPDIILLDVLMPDMNGFEVLSELKKSDTTKYIPVIFLTAMSDALNEAQGIELGAIDYIMKPFSKPVLLNRLKNHLHIDELIRDRTAQLSQRTEELARQTEQLAGLKNGIVFTLADVIEGRDSNTGGHIDRTSAYMKILIEAMLERGVYGDEMQGWDLDLVVSSARLHDLGKISIPDSILNKPGKLTDEEFLVIKTHPEAGMRIIDQMMDRTKDADFLHNAKQFVAYHHEKWDGSGYPYGLAGTNIPFQGRIMAVIDVYDALVSDRPYKKSFSHEKAVDIIVSDSGTHFDPLIVDIFNEINEQILAHHISNAKH